MGKLLVLFILIPAVELILLIELGGLIGTLLTIGIIVLTGVAGASLARWQGLSVLHQLQREIASGQLPAGALVDGVIILIAGALLMTPGFLTDTVGFLLLVPGVRRVVKRALRARFERSIREGRTNVFLHIGP